MVLDIRLSLWEKLMESKETPESRTLSPCFGEFLRDRSAVEVAIFMRTEGRNLSERGKYGKAAK